jgi:hypothetical protein
MSVALILGRSDPLDCEMAIDKERIDKLELLANNFNANSIQKCVEHAHMLYGMLPSFSLPHCKSGSVIVIRHIWEGWIRTSLGCTSSKGTIQLDALQGQLRHLCDR